MVLANPNYDVFFLYQLVTSSFCCQPLSIRKWSLTLSFLHTRSHDC